MTGILSLEMYHLHVCFYLHIRNPSLLCVVISLHSMCFHIPVTCSHALWVCHVYCLCFHTFPYTYVCCVLCVFPHNDILSQALYMHRYVCFVYCIYVLIYTCISNLFLGLAGMCIFASIYVLMCMCPCVH